jgi:hypothetical protein
MKRETNNEMDLLLRRLGRRDGLSAPAAGDHLDADELNGYAENVLPAASRARYTEHLADCGSCGELVVRLSAAAAVVVAPETVKVAGPSVLKKFLASLFSPMVLRYAAPALGLIVVAVIGLVVLRRNNSSELVTQVQQPSASISPNEPTAKPYSGEFGKQKTEPSVEGRAKQSPENTKSVEPVAAPNNPPAGTQQPSGSPDTAGPKREQVAVASEPPPPPAKEAAKAVVQTVDKQQEVVIVEPPKAAVGTAPATQPSANRNFEERRDRQDTDLAADRATRGNRKAPATAASRSAGGIAKLGDNKVDKVDRAESKEKAANAEKDDEAETRSVGGRRFRKQRGIWIDTAYESGSTTNLTRGSEQYRALVGDEPTIKTIADQLDGELIVVWKGRAYRIR